MLNILKFDQKEVPGNQGRQFPYFIFINILLKTFLNGGQAARCYSHTLENHASSLCLLESVSCCTWRLTSLWKRFVEKVEH